MPVGLIRGYKQHLVSPSPGQGRTDPLDRGLVGEWRFDPASGLVLPDYSGYGNHGTLVGTPTWVRSERGPALDFDGVGDYVDVGTRGAGLTSTGTIAAWIYKNGTSITGSTGIVSNASGGTAGDINWILGFDFTNKDRLRGIISNNVALNTITDDGDFPVGAWHHTVFTWDGLFLYLYIDGSEAIAKVAQTLNAQDDSFAFEIGSFVVVATQFEFKGSIDSVRIYNRGFTAGEVAKLYQLGLHRANPMYSAWMLPWGKAPAVAGRIPRHPATYNTLQIYGGN